MKSDRAGSDSVNRPFYGWRMLIIAFLAMNCAIGMNFGVYATLVSTLQQQFGTTRSLASAGLSMMTLALGLMSPLVGTLIRRVPVRFVMMVGAALNAVGYLLLGTAESIQAVLAIYALIIGPGVSMLSVVPCSTIVNNWFVDGRGRALGFLNMPLLVFVMPMLSASVLVRFGVDAVFLMVAGIFVALIPALALLVAAPEDIGQSALGVERAARIPHPSGGDSNSTAPPKTAQQLLGTPAFLILSLCVGITTAAGVMMTTHLTPLAQDKGLSLQAAASVQAAFGFAAAAGSFLFGWLADRIGGPRAMTAQVFAWILPWTAMLFSGAELGPLLIIAALMGVCSGGIVGLSSVIMNLWLGKQNFSRGMGYMYLLKVPFLFGAAPFAGYLFDITGNYNTAILVHIASFIVVGLMIFFYRPPAASPASP